MNLRLPSVKTDTTLPTKSDGAGAVDFPRYTEMPGQRDGEADLTSRILNYIGLALKHKYLIMVMVAIFMFGGLIETMLTPKIYSAATTIKIDRSTPTVFKSQTGVGSESDYDVGFYQTQYELIRSRTLAEQVAAALYLGQSDFFGRPQPSLFKRLFMRLDS